MHFIFIQRLCVFTLECLLVTLFLQVAFIMTFYTPLLLFSDKRD